MIDQQVLLPGMPAETAGKGRGKHFVKANGYAMRPGTGPEGKRCKDCEFIRKINLSNKDVFKCVLCVTNWTRSRRTDILANSPACSRFSEEANA
jgi:hypothetical protein